MRQDSAFSISSFNTQPPEGGWVNEVFERLTGMYSFNTQPPEGGWKSS